MPLRSAVLTALSAARKAATISGKHVTEMIVIGMQNQSGWLITQTPTAMNPAIHETATAYTAIFFRSVGFTSRLRDQIAQSAASGS